MSHVNVSKAVVIRSLYVQYQQQRISPEEYSRQIAYILSQPYLVDHDDFELENELELLNGLLRENIIWEADYHKQREMLSKQAEKSNRIGLKEKVSEAMKNQPIAELLDKKKRAAAIEALEARQQAIEAEIAQAIQAGQERAKKQEAEFEARKAQLNYEVSRLQDEINEMKNEISELEKDVKVKHYNFADYDGLSSEECKNKLALLRIDQNEMIKNEKAVSGHAYHDKKAFANNVKRLLRCFGAECENVLLNLGVKNIDSSRSKIQRSFETLNKLFAGDYIAITKELFASKLEELNLVYTFELKREYEREQQKAIKEQMIEEEKVLREIEREKAKIEKDQSQVNGEISRMMKYLQKTENDVEKQLYVDKIKELEARLKELEENKATVLEREANARAGFVYVISNIGSFGSNVFKIGMTRRLEPMDRINELSSASVPFDFDVHAMIFSNDAPALETVLHTHFEKNSVNKINPRKEFFRVKIEEVADFVKKNHSDTAEFTYAAIASQYYQTLEIEKSRDRSN